MSQLRPENRKADASFSPELASGSRFAELCADVGAALRIYVAV
jgi:hypothetical protein